jgi:hypothetical protein
MYNVFVLINNYIIYNTDIFIQQYYSQLILFSIDFL